ncbi:hypothetical protein [Bacteriovorax sp. Seq25_V]|uniref:hypothetical protein n=1 Tax=Bacteriovorax sp. Seq25_V TaxID=1201288 RepID=UPI00038A4FB2|nr:hypothetical protein [Bacteriovorax sp. Seq25_V]EQC47095.1 hypothetical protein M900_0512 [Bacteriovorax sp. Seq25_V]
MKSIYLYNALTGHRESDNKNENAYYLSRLLNLRNELLVKQVQIADVAPKLLEVIKNHPSFEKVSRVCLAINLPLSNKLEVLSVGTTIDNNLMKSGYSCFISSKSSLQKINNGDTRVFSNIDNILESYVNDNKPAQRSIFYLSKMGVKSGITIQLKSGGLTGYLFLNSNEIGYFDSSIKSDSTYLNLLELVCTEVFSSLANEFRALGNIDDYIARFPKEYIFSNIHQKNHIGIELLSESISQYIHGNIKFEIVDNTEASSLIPWGQVSLILSVILKDLKLASINNLPISLYEEEENLLVSISSKEVVEEMENLPIEYYKAIRKFSKNLGIELSRSRDKFWMKLKIDKYSHREVDVDYSTPHE